MSKHETLKALRNAYLFIGIPISAFSGYKGYKYSDTYLENYPNNSKFEDSTYEYLVRSSLTVGGIVGGFIFPITLPVYLHTNYDIPNTIFNFPVDQHANDIKNDLEE